MRKRSRRRRMTGEEEDRGRGGKGGEGGGIGGEGGGELRMYCTVGGEGC